ncbi:MAG: hypothetical protein AAFQ42_07470 [Pseudomonadota bacterium]
MPNGSKGDGTVTPVTPDHLSALQCPDSETVAGTGCGSDLEGTRHERD